MPRHPTKESCRADWDEYGRQLDEYRAQQVVILLGGKTAAEHCARGSGGFTIPRGQLERTSYHECGHAILARAFGDTIYHLTIEPRPDIKVLRADGAEGWHAGGYAAHGEKPAPETPSGQFPDGEARDDELRVRELIGYIAGGDTSRIPELRSGLEKTTAHLVTEYWPEIATLAQVLLVKKTLTQQEIEDILAPPKRRWPVEAESVSAA